MQRKITSLWGEKKVILRQTPRAVTPFGGLSVFIDFMKQIGFPVYWARPEAEDWFLSVRPAIETSCEKFGYAVRDLVIELEIEPQEQVDHSVCGLVIKEPTGK